jgi:hypothetical protein
VIVMISEGCTPAHGTRQPVDTATVVEVGADSGWWDEETATTPIPSAHLRSAQPAGRIRRARDRPQRSLAAARVAGFLGLVVVVIFVMAVNHDAPRSAEGDSGTERGRSEDHGPGDLPGGPPGALLGDVLGYRLAGAWPAGPIEMPVSVPNARWQGWDRRPAGRCAWISPGLLDPLTFVARPEPTQSTCRLLLTTGTRVSILWARPGARIVWDPFSDSRDIAVAGLSARLSELDLVQSVMPGACEVSVHTRGPTGFVVLAWRPTDRAGGPVRRCDDALFAAELVARARVPAAGGTPWAPAPRMPSARAVVGASACELLESSPTIDRDDGLITNLTLGQPPRGRAGGVSDSCAVRRNGMEITLQLVSDMGSSVDEVASQFWRPRRDATSVTYRRFAGALPTRQDRSSHSCALTVEIRPGHFLRSSYASTTRTAPCVEAELLTNHAVVELLDRTAS